MGIAESQKKRIIEEITRAYYATGEKPRLTDILTDTSTFFAKFPIGQPLPLPSEYAVYGLQSDVDKFNEVFARMSLNLDVLYETCNEQVDDIMTLTTLLRTSLARMKSRRERMMAKIDDYLFALYNTDGYYYSASDTFSDLELSDLTLTSAFIDTQTGTVQLPTISSLTRRVTPDKFTGFTTKSYVGGVEVSHKTLSPISGAIDGLTNTLWGIEVQTAVPQEVVVVLTMNFHDADKPVTISRVDFDPYGITPIQLFLQTQSFNSSGIPEIVDFGNTIKTSLYNMSFVDSARETKTLEITMRKVEPDYTHQVSGTTKYRYLFGAKNIVITEQVYDNQATFVSQPLYLDSELASDNVIDAVSLVANYEEPEDTEIIFYVASDTSGQTQLSDYDWKRISPLENIQDNPNAIVKFDGARSFVRFIRQYPSATELQLIPLDSTNRDLKLRNPSPAIISGASVYRIADFAEADIIPASVVLEEGVNTTRIMHIPYNADAYESLSFWREYANGTNTASTVYGRIDVGNEFFYGGDIGESGRSVFIETKLESATDQELILKEVSKLDANSKTWDMKVFLNGREVADMPVGINSVVVPWKFQQGENHIAVLVNIPTASNQYPNPYIGTIDIMGDDDIYDFGTVKLATWEYIDLFKMQYNEVDQPYSFTIYDGEIISRRKPTTNFRIRYSKPTSQAPSSVRLRADLRRQTQNPNITPILKDYRLRFLYANR